MQIMQLVLPDCSVRAEGKSLAGDIEEAQTITGRNRAIQHAGIEDHRLSVVAVVCEPAAA